MIRLSDKFQLLGSSFLSQALRIATTLVVARYVPPLETGLYYLILSVPGILTAFNDFSIPQSLIKLREFPEPVLLDTAFVLASILYVIYGSATIGGGIYLTHTMHDPRLWKVSVIVAVTGLISSLYDLQLACLNRNLQFNIEGRQNLICSFSIAASGIAFAISRFGIYALAWQLFVGQIVANIAIYRRRPLHFPRHASWSAAKRFMALGGPVALSSYVGNVEGSIVNLAIKQFFGTASLGLWGKALQVQQLFAQNLMQSFNRVAYPLLCHNVADKARMRTLFARVTVTMVMVSGLFAAVFFADNDAMVRIALGHDWIASGPLLQITAIAVPAGAITSVAYMMCLALGTTQTLLRISVANIVLFLPLVYFSRRWGMSGLAGAWTLSRYFIAVTMLGAATHRIQTGLRAVAKEMILLTIATAGAALAMIFFNRTLPIGWPILIRFCLSGGIGTIAYVALVWILQRDAIMYAVNMTRRAPAAADTSPAEAPAPHVTPTIPVDSPAFLLNATGMSAAPLEQQDIQPPAGS